jgi:hypothetical protein
MIVLDENIRDSHADLLRKDGIASRKIGINLKSKGTSDADIIPLLHRLKQPTFFPHDVDFWRPELSHANYRIVHLAVKPRDAAFYIRRFLRHPQFSTAAKRLGKVIQVRPNGLSVIRTCHSKAANIEWLIRNP